VLNKISNVICTVCITGRGGVVGALKLYVGNLNVWDDLWDKNTEGRIKRSR